jgi:hypothetical protein
MQIEIPSRFTGPPNIGHGGYVAGLLTTGASGAVQVTLRRPAPLDVPLDLVDEGEGHRSLRTGDDVIAQSEPSTLDLDVPPAPSLDQARAAEPGSPSFYNGRGVHGVCFGCSSARDEGDGMRIFAGPTSVDGTDLVAAAWRPGAAFASDDGTVDAHWVLAALDCPGAFAFIVDDQRAGLLGRIVFEQFDTVRADADLVVGGWQVGTDGKKLFAGTALYDATGAVLAAAKATWFPFPVMG